MASFNLVITEPSPFRRVLRRFTVRRDEFGGDFEEYRLLVGVLLLYQFRLGKRELAVIEQSINLGPGTTIAIEGNAPLYVTNILIDNLDETHLYAFGNISFAPQFTEQQRNALLGGALWQANAVRTLPPQIRIIPEPLRTDPTEEVGEGRMKAFLKEFKKGK
jgi:hypothetical protein